MEKPDPQSLPLAPGVYLYKDERGRIIYVGKARVLRRRVLSYFQIERRTAKTRAMLAHAHALDIIATTTEKEALLLEASLIKKHRPRYNIVLRDDKQYVLFKLNLKHPFPRLEIVRRVRRDGARLFGPFTSASSARETWKLLHKAFGLRRCSDRAMKNRVRPCLYHHMGQCPAPCMGLISPEEYGRTAHKVSELLEGHAADLLAGLRAEMNRVAEALEFEEAAVLRDRIQAVECTVERQAAVLPGGGDMDVVGLFPADKGLAVGVAFVRGGAVMDGRGFYFGGLEFEDAPELLWAFLSQFYTTLPPPPRVLLPWLPPEESGAEEGDSERSLMELALSEKRGGAVRIVAPQNALDNQLVDIAAANAREEARYGQKGSPADALASALRLPIPLRRIECVDISHTGGRETRAGLIVFEDGRPVSGDSRVYTMPDGGDDCASLYAWAARRLKSGPPWPDLLLIDGGRGQLAAVRRALAEAGEEGRFPLAAIAKARNEEGRADRRAGNVSDRVFIPGRANPLPLREGGPELLFLQRIRDAAHRFVIGRHRRAHRSVALSGELMRLPGIGPATARLLWEKFGSIEAMRAAGEEELRAVPGIGPKKALELLKKLEILQS
ncbi:MAG: excinuclease ABC subunit UvrC [Desulfovibrio sp.]|nr:excinuclease ABC subunit UvrC [Desulfovibrio sp.]